MATALRRTQEQMQQRLAAKDDDCCGCHTLCGWTKVNHFGQWLINEHNAGPKSYKDTCAWTCDYGLKTLFCCKMHQPPKESDEMDARCKRCALCCLSTATVVPACCSAWTAHQQAQVYYAPPKQIMS